jgi:hypothetical protein
MQGEPVATLDERYSAPAASATPWSEGRERLERAEIYWITTIRPEGRPHVTPLIAVWLDDSLFFCTGEREQKFRNLAANPHCSLITGQNTYDEGLDLVIEGEAVRVLDEATLTRVADAYRAKYGSDWSWDVRDAKFHSTTGTVALVFEVAPVTGYGFGKGTFSQTRWSFES